MPCFFCETDDHISLNCSIHVTDEAWKAIFVAKKCCKKCLGVGSNYGADSESCPYCISLRKCYNCFSRSHYTKDCTDEFIAINFFLPKTDRDLLPRFMKMLTAEENYSLIFKYPNIVGVAYSKPLKIAFKTHFSFPTHERFLDSDFVVVDKLLYQNDFPFSMRYSYQNCRFSENTNFRIKHLECCNCTLSVVEYLQLLSARTRSLFGSIKFKSKLNLYEILQKAPNLQEFDFSQTNIAVDISWPEDILLFNSSFKMVQINLLIPDFKFNVKSLATLMKEKDVSIQLYNAWPLNMYFNSKTAFEEVTKTLSSHFFSGILYGMKSLRISFLCDCTSMNHYGSNMYTLKKL